MAFNEAVKTESNLGIVSALLTGTLVLSLYASFFVYNEPITKIQASGSVLLLIGNSTLALFAKSESKT
jgi:multidrug transporter EmrE-like cation transporter